MSLGTLYALGFLWSGALGSRSCPAIPVVPHAIFELAWPVVLEAPSAVTAFVDVNVVPMDTERVLPHQTVLVEGGRIMALGPVNQIKVPAGAVRVDGRGRYLMPGLTDMHVHLHMWLGYKDDEAVYRLFRYLATGITAVRHLGRATEPLIRLRSADVLGPRLYFSPDVRSLESMRLDSVAAFVAGSKAAGYDFLEVRADYKRRLPVPQHAVYDSLLVTARRLGITVASHTNGESFEELLALGAYGGSVEHIHYAFKDLLGRSEAEVSAAELQSRASAVRRAGAWVSVTLDCVENRGKGNIAVARKLVKALQDTGVGLLLGADAESRPPAKIHVELANLVRAGLTPYQALATGTRNVAQYLGTLDSTGTVAVGKWADLVLLTGNPLQDVQHLEELAGVMIDGRWLPRQEIDRRLAFRSPDEQKQRATQFAKNAYSSLWISDDQLQAKHKAEQAVLADSLIMPDSLGGKADVVAAREQRLLTLVARQLGEQRTVLTPAQQAVFDLRAREWLQQHAARGYRVDISGVVPEP